MNRIVPLFLMTALVASAGCSNKELIKQKDTEIAGLQSQVGDLQRSLDEQRRMNDQLNSQLADLKDQNRILIEEKDNLTHITLDGSATFGTAQADLTPEAKEVLDRIWDVLQNYPDRQILIEGHTDNRPIRMSYRHVFASNWELSSARAHSVLHYLVHAHNADTNRLAAVGYGESKPVADNSTREGREQNRRVVITAGSKMDIQQRVISQR